MALLELYMDSATGNDFNSGTSTGSPVTVTGATTSLPFIAVAGQVLRVTAASGTPFSAVSAGQWASVWTSAQTVSTAFIGQIYAINGGGSSIDIYQENSQPGTNCFGQADSINGTGNGQFGAGNTVNVNVGGPWASLNSIVPSNNASGAFAGGGHGSPTGAVTAYDIRVNVKAGTYSNSASRTLPAGATTHPIIWRGFNTTPGDLQDATTYAGLATTITNTSTGAAATISGSLALPLFSFSGTAQLTWGNYNYARSLAFFGSASSGTIAAAQLVYLDRCTMTTTSSNKNIQGSGGINATGCFFFAVNGNSIQTDGGNTTLTGCTFRGGNNGIYNQAVVAASLCIFEGQGTNGFYHTNGANSTFTNCTFSGWNGSTTASGSGIQFNYTINGSMVVVNSIFSRYTGYGINAVSTNRLVAWNNATYSLSGGSLVGSTAPSSFNMIGGTITESSNPFVSDTGHDYTLVSTAASRQAGFPGQFEV